MLAHMVAIAEDDLICDFAQYYHMDFRELTLEYAGILAYGLPAESRIFTKMRQKQMEQEKIKEEIKRKNRKYTDNDEMIVKSSEEFEALRAELLRS